MITQNNKIIKCNSKVIVSNADVLFTINNINTTTSSRFKITVTSPITIFFDDIPLIIPTSSNQLYVVNILLPLIKTYNVNIKFEDLSKITKLEIGYYTTGVVKGVFSNRINNLINLDYLSIGSNTDKIKQQIVVPISIKSLILNETYVIINNDILNRLNNLIECTLHIYRNNIDVTQICNNNRSIQILYITSPFGYNSTGNITNISNSLIQARLIGNYTGTMDNLHNNPNIKNISFNVSNIPWNNNYVNTTKMYQIMTGVNSIVNIYKYMNEQMDIPDYLYVYLKGTTTGSCTDAIDPTAIGYNETQYLKILNKKVYAFRIFGSNTNVTGKVELLYNIITPGLTYYFELFICNTTHNENLILNLDNLNTKGKDNVNKSNVFGITNGKITGDMNIFNQARIEEFEISSCNLLEVIHLNAIALLYRAKVINLSGCVATNTQINTLVSTIFDNKALYNNTVIKTLQLISVNYTVLGIYQQPNLGTYTGNIHDLTEQQLINLKNGLDYTGSGTTTPWTSREMIWILVNLNISSTNSTKRYKWTVTY